MNTPATPALPPYFRALWNIAPRIAPLEPSPNEADVPPRPILSGVDPRVLHLPLHAAFAQDETWRQAAASHAAAHWRFGGPAIPRGKLKPVQQALLGVLEDARVEWLALQALPGLRGLWLPFHEGPEAADGSGFDALLGRLARTLLDPTHADPHPWVAKARAAFFATDGVTPALQTPEAVRQAASLLGADIGQMRLPFNVRTYRVHAAYRDDNSHLWLQDDALPPSDTPLEDGEGRSAEPDAAAAPPVAVPATPRRGDAGAAEAAEQATAVYPEWDHVIGRYRPAWCHVFASGATGAGSAGDEPGPGAAARVAPLVRAIAALRGPAVRGGGRSHDGDELHFGALVDARIDRHLRRPDDLRVYRRMQRPPPPLAVMLLLDTSASTARRPADGPPDGPTLLDTVRRAAHDTAAALHRLGHRSALWGFASAGRHRVDMACVKDWRDAADAPVVARRLAALRSGGSTRLGAVLRHAVALSAADALRHPGWQRVVVFVTDGEPHDVDVHDADYLPADLRRAADEARRRGIAVRAAVLPPGDPRRMAAIIGAAHCAGLQRVDDLPRRLPRLLAAGV